MTSKFITKFIAGAALAVPLMLTHIQAAQITGGISFAGDYRPVDASANIVSDLTLASWLEFGPTATIGATVVTAAVDDFSSIAPGSLTTIASPLAVNPAGALPAGALWSVDGFSFTLSSILETYVDSTRMTFTGVGTITGPGGFDPTPGEWIATMNTLGGTYSWSASSAAVHFRPTVSGVVSCPNGDSAANIVVYVTGVGSTTTTGNGAYSIELPDVGTYTVCVDPTSLPPGASVVGNNCANFTVNNGNPFASVNFTLTGPFCGTTPPPGPCWLTGGGTVDKTKGQPDYSYGGVVNPGCSPTAAGGGNWNVVDHLQNLHFKGLDISVIACSGAPTTSPKVNVRIIDFEGTGILKGVSGNTMPVKVVSFIARAIDNAESGGGKDQLYLNVYDPVTTASLLLISTDPAHPMNVAPKTITTGNLQIHTTSCN